MIILAAIHNPMCILCASYVQLLLCKNLNHKATIVKEILQSPPRHQKNGADPGQQPCSMSARVPTRSTGPPTSVWDVGPMWVQTQGKPDVSTRKRQCLIFSLEIFMDLEIFNFPMFPNLKPGISWNIRSGARCTQALSTLRWLRRHWALT